MNKGYVLFVILNDVKRYRRVKVKLKDLGYNRFTVVDTYGTTDILTSMQFSNMLSGVMSGQSNKRYNKTILLVLKNEEEVNQVMDGIEECQHLEVSRPGKGIMFTVPIFTYEGVRFGD